MTEREVLHVLEGVGAIVTGGHFVYTSGRHSDTYVNKDALYPHIYLTSFLCQEIARRFAGDDVDVVVSPALGGIVLSQWTAYHLCEFMRREVLAVYAEKVARPQVSDNFFMALTQMLAYDFMKKHAGNNGFVLTRGYDKLVAGKNVLVVEDTLTTGGSAKKVVDLVRAHGGKVVGVGCLCNGGRITKQNLGVPKLVALLNMPVASYEAKYCMLCARNIPINTDLGKGCEFLSRRGI